MTEICNIRVFYRNFNTICIKLTLVNRLYADCLTRMSS